MLTADLTYWWKLFKRVALITGVLLSFLGLIEIIHAFSVLKVTGSTNSDIGWEASPSFLQWFWYPDEEDGPHNMSAKLISNKIDTDSKYTYDVSVTLSWYINGYYPSNRYVSADFYCNSWSTTIPVTQLFNENYSGGINISDSTTISITDVTPLVNGEMQLVFNWDLDDFTFAGGRNYLRITKVKIDRKYEGTEYSSPEFEYSYNTSIKIGRAHV